MTEDLLAFVAIVAVWKIVQVWVLKNRVGRIEREKAVVGEELDRISSNYEQCRHSLGIYQSHFGPIRSQDTPMHMGKTESGQKIDVDWPEIFN